MAQTAAEDRMRGIILLVASAIVAALGLYAYTDPTLLGSPPGDMSTRWIGPAIMLPLAALEAWLGFRLLRRARRAPP